MDGQSLDARTEPGMVKQKQQDPTKPEPSTKALKATIKDLRARLLVAEERADRADARLAKAKDKAKRHKTAAAEAERRTAKLTKRLAKVQRADPAPPVEPVPVEVPDPSWTVTRLRAVARERSVAGASRMNKQQLLAALR